MICFEPNYLFKPIKPVLTRFLLGFLIAAALFGCKAKTGTPKAPAFAVEKHYKKGSAEVILRLSRNEITVAEKTTLEIEARTESGYTVTLPDLKNQPDSLQVADSDSPEPSLERNSRVHCRKQFTLKPFLPGTATIPSLKISVSKSGDRSAAPIVIETQPVDIRVKSLLASDSDAQIREILPPGTLPNHYFMVIGGIVAVLTLLAGLFFGIWSFWLRKKFPIDAEVVRLPHEIALSELETLLSEHMIDLGEYKAFYLRLSAILRHYIENRFGLRAPEQTTEEFLAAAKSAGDLATDHKLLLKRFLEHCDLVKFAELRPTDGEIRETLDTFKRFVAETKQVPTDKMIQGEKRHAV